MIRHPKPSLESAHDPLRAYQSKRDFALTPEPQRAASPLPIG